jgi:uncharacterized protein (TIGR02646 family)
MKHVRKAPEEPAVFTAWKAKASADWQPAYENLQNPEKHTLHAALLAEQGYVCCYCGCAITQTDSHIEHFRPQESHADLALEYRNLHASCMRETHPGIPLHCGHAKGRDFDQDKAISPLDAHCEQRFIYALDGSIKPARDEDVAAHYMRELLKLDIAFLRNRRANVLQKIFDPDFLDSASREELQRLAQSFRQPDKNGRLTGFGHVVARFAEDLL